jgi:hypothetical protein
MWNYATRNLTEEKAEISCQNCDIRQKEVGGDRLLVFLFLLRYVKEASSSRDL